MPGINFLQHTRKEEIIEKESFGICDKPGERPAFISFNEDDTWIATVNNPNLKRIQFLPVDNHIPLEHEDGTKLKRCDAMLLTSPTHDKEIVIFVELKDVIARARNAAKNQAIEQLKQTIESFSEYHQLASYKIRHAYVANRKQPAAKQAHTKDIQEFRKNYRITLKFSSTIIFP